MIIEFINAKPVSQEQLSEIEAEIGYPLPLEVKEWYMKYGGAVPEVDGNSCLITIEHSDGWKQESYIELIDDYNSLVKHIKFGFGENGYLREMVSSLKKDTDYIEYQFLFPIAVLPNGCVYCAIAGKYKGSIYLADTGDFGIIYHSKSLQDFIASLHV